MLAEDGGHSTANTRSGRQRRALYLVGATHIYTAYFRDVGRPNRRENLRRLPSGGPAAILVAICGTGGSGIPS